MWKGPLHGLCRRRRTPLPRARRSMILRAPGRRKRGSGCNPSGRAAETPAAATATRPHSGPVAPVLPSRHAPRPFDLDGQDACPTVLRLATLTSATAAAVTRLFASEGQGALCRSPPVRRFGSPKMICPSDACLFYATKGSYLPSSNRYHTALPHSWPPCAPTSTQARSFWIFFAPFSNLTRLPAYRSAADTDQQSTVYCGFVSCIPSPITDVPAAIPPPKPQSAPSSDLTDRSPSTFDAGALTPLVRE